MGKDRVELAVAALSAGQAVLLPTDGVYGLCAIAGDERAVRRMYRLKGRSEGQPSAVIAASIEQLLDLIPELEGPAETALRALLPGPFTLVFGNPARRFPWASGEGQVTIGVRVARLPAAAEAVLSAVGAVVATSANDVGGPTPARLEEVPERIRAGCGAEIDAGALPGIASTVIDFSGAEPRVLREGAASAAAAIARVQAALRASHGA